MEVRVESANVLRLMLDSDVLNKLANNYRAVERLRELVEAGEVKLLITHVQVDETTRASDPGDLARRELLRNLAAMARSPPRARSSTSRSSTRRPLPPTNKPDARNAHG